MSPRVKGGSWVECEGANSICVFAWEAAMVREWKMSMWCGWAEEVNRKMGRFGGEREIVLRRRLGVKVVVGGRVEALEKKLPVRR